MIGNDHSADGSERESSRLVDYWEARYQRFVLSESGWSGAGERLNERIYACKSEALRAALEALALPRTFSILDAGCGQGYFTGFYRDTFPCARYIGIDISRRVVHHLQAAFPGVRIEAGDLSTWCDRGGARFDVIQAIDVFQMILDDDFAARVVANLSGQLTARGALILTASFPSETFEPAPYLRHRSQAHWTALLDCAGLAIVRDAPMYYWLPAGGPLNKYARHALSQLGSGALYALDRAALRLGLPQPQSSAIDNRLRMLTIKRVRH